MPVVGSSCVGTAGAGGFRELGGLLGARSSSPSRSLRPPEEDEDDDDEDEEDDEAVEVVDASGAIAPPHAATESVIAPATSMMTEGSFMRAPPA